MTDPRGSVAEWRHLEERFYASALQEPELYMAGIRLVRAVADGLAGTEELGELERRYRDVDSEWVVPFAQRLDTPQLALLDYELVLGAAFYLRAGEIEAADDAKRAAAMLTAARARGESWVVLYDRRRERNGFTFRDQVQIRPTDGAGVRLTSDLDWERGAVYGVQSLRVDPASGRLIRESSGPRREFASAEEQRAEADRLLAALAADGAGP